MLSHAYYVFLRPLQCLTGRISLTDDIRQATQVKRCVPP